MKVVLLAGGFGTRISEESHLRPKPMIEIGGNPMLWHIMKYYSSFGFNEFIICCGYKGYLIKEYFANYYMHRSDITFDFSEKNHIQVHNNAAEPWKVTVVDTGLHTMTGGRIKRIKPYVGNEPFMITYGDGVSNINLNSLLNQHKASDKIVTISAVQPRGRFGILDIDEKSNTVIGFREKDKEDGRWINIGFMVMNPGIFDYLDDDNCVLEQYPLKNLSKNNGLGVYKHLGFWQCMDTQRDKGMLEHMWNADKAEWKIWEN